jgi:hypothetical protein
MAEPRREHESNSDAQARGTAFGTAKAAELYSLARRERPTMFRSVSVAVAQLVERWIVAPAVAGSNPVGHPDFSCVPTLPWFSPRHHMPCGILGSTLSPN